MDSPLFRTASKSQKGAASGASMHHKGARPMAQKFSGLGSTSQS